VVNQSAIVIRSLTGLQDYRQTWEAMQRFSATRSADSSDELWLLQHPPVFTHGLNSKAKHLHDPGDIPVIHTDRGGQVTYHGPGQLIVYVLMDLPRRRWGVRKLVNALEQAVIGLLAGYGITGEAHRAAPGVYVDGAKIAALGLRVRHGRCYHGLSLNVAMDLSPFQRINPCGYPALRVTQLSELTDSVTFSRVAHALAEHMTQHLK
jgi:lipoyl(octanoyl) transferase